MANSDGQGGATGGLGERMDEEMIYELESRFDEDGIKVTNVTRDEKRYLSYLYKQIVDGLMDGIRPEADKAIVFMNEKYPRRVKAMTDRLEKDYSESGLREFERSMLATFKNLGVWNG